MHDNDLWICDDGCGAWAIAGEGNLIIEGALSFDGAGYVDTIRDEDDMASNSSTSLATQQSIKAYHDDNLLDLGNGTAFDIIVHDNLAEQFTSAIPKTKIKEIIFYATANNLNVSFEMKSDNGVAFVSSRVYLNGVGVSGFFDTDSTTYLPFSYNIPVVSNGDLVQIYGSSNPGSTCYIRNMKITYTQFVNNDP